MQLSKPLNVLIVEDNQVDRKVIESMLKEKSNAISLVKSATTLNDAVGLLKTDAFDVVILDLDLPDCKGEETVKKIYKQFPKVAIVVNTGEYEDDLGLRTLSIGAQDFLVKGKYNPYLLNRVLNYAIERKRLEFELKRAYHQLKSAQDQLVQAEKMKVVGGLASGVAHEVKNPLATILYGVTYLDQNVKIDDEKVKLVLDNIKEATNRANEIITDLLDFSSLNKLTTKKQSINDVVEKSLILVHHECEKNHIKVNKIFEDNVPNIQIDENRIEQVLVNLTLNAIHAMPEGGQLSIFITAQKLSKDLSEIPNINRNGFKPGQEVVMVKIEDSGVGIPQDKIDSIFDPFVTSRRGEGGVGLGLSVSRNIMKNHSGGIIIENREKGGVCATLVFKT